MVILITGGSGSGKSAYAEQLALKLYKSSSLSGRSQTGSRTVDPAGSHAPSRRLIYLATMYNDPDDPETAARIQRHRIMRSNKGFITIEQPVNISEAPLLASDTVILEDIPNLLANEMYRKYPASRCEETADADNHEKKDYISYILNELKKLPCADLVMVTGIIDLDGTDYDPYTMEYIRTLSGINRMLTGYSDKVTAVTAGIPVVLKG